VPPKKVFSCDVGQRFCNFSTPYNFIFGDFGKFSVGWGSGQHKEPENNRKKLFSQRVKMAREALVNSILIAKIAIFELFKFAEK
jgi:hypothetical protein